MVRLLLRLYSIAGPSIRVTKERITEGASHVLRAAEEISARLGYRVQSDGAGKATVRKIFRSRGAAERRPPMKVESFKAAIRRLGISSTQTPVPVRSFSRRGHYDLGDH